MMAARMNWADFCGFFWESTLDINELQATEKKSFIILFVIYHF
jgi:hypothetical protein